MLAQIIKRLNLHRISAEGRAIYSELHKMWKHRKFPLLSLFIIDYLSLFLLLLYCIRALGIDSIDLGAFQIFIAFAFSRFLVMLSITPGGVGLVELGLGYILTLGAHFSVAIISAIMLYRILTFLITIPIGILTLLIWVCFKPS